MEFSHKSVLLNECIEALDIKPNGIYVDGVRLGNMGIVHPTVSKKIDKKASIVFLEIDVKDFAALVNESISYTEPSRFPEMEIDLSFVSDTFAPIGEAIKNQNCDLYTAPLAPW